MTHPFLFQQFLDVATAGAVALLRGGSGAFVQGYKVEFVAEDEGASVESILSLSLFAHLFVCVRQQLRTSTNLPPIRPP